MAKRSHDEMEGVATKEEVVGGPRREMQGQGDKKHSIDSDEEDDEKVAFKRFEKMHDDDIEGQEDDTLAFDGDIAITPFNLKEEQQEGSFSKDGNFVWNDKKEEIRDAWLDNVDWVKIKEKSKEEREREDEEEEREEEEEANYDETNNYKAILEFLKPGESVAKALRRLGGGKTASASQRWSKKKKEETEQEKENKQKMLKLTGLADAVLSRSGNMEIYEETYEADLALHYLQTLRLFYTYGISFKLEAKGKSKQKTLIPEGTDADDALDMFAESLDDKEPPPSAAAGRTAEGAAVAGGGENGSNGQAAAAAAGSSNGASSALSDEIMWEFKWKNEPEAEVHGPHDSSQMLEWQESGFFDKGVFARKVGSGGDFNSSKRIDFELYT